MHEHFLDESAQALGYQKAWIVCVRLPIMCSIAPPS
jgi:hypothetical protein